MASEDYAEFVVVAEDEWELSTNSSMDFQGMECDNKRAKTETAVVQFSAQLGGLKWICKFTGQTSFSLECTDVVEGHVSEVQTELILYGHAEGTGPNSGHIPIYSPYQMHGNKTTGTCNFQQIVQTRHLFVPPAPPMPMPSYAPGGPPAAPSMNMPMPIPSCVTTGPPAGHQQLMMPMSTMPMTQQAIMQFTDIYQNRNNKAVFAAKITNQPSPRWICYHMCPKNKSIRLTLRILKRRSEFPDFSEANNKIARLGGNRKLKVADRIFHVNKELLSLHSPYFHQLFNGNFANQDVIELKWAKTEGANQMDSEELFLDLLLAITPPGNPNKLTVLPNRKNVAALFQMATFYQMDSVLAKCERHLMLCREMPITERVALAKKYGLAELKRHIISVITDSECQEVLRFLLDNNGAAQKCQYILLDFLTNGMTPEKCKQTLFMLINDDDDNDYGMIG